MRDILAGGINMPAGLIIPPSPPGPPGPPGPPATPSSLKFSRTPPNILPPPAPPATPSSAKLSRTPPNIPSASAPPPSSSSPSSTQIRIPILTPLKRSKKFTSLNIKKPSTFHLII